MSEQLTPNPSVPSQIVQELHFPKYINNLGIIPTSYKDSMSYYECLAWLCKYLEETVIPTLNQNGEAVEELQGLYIELNSYVTNYFENLDVQEEINNKLDEMVRTGTLQDSLSIYFRDLENTYTQRYIDIENEADTRYNQIESLVNEVDGKITSVASGSPAGVYNTVSDLTNADPNHSKIYVVLNDNKWYYYNSSNSTWTAGGTYQSTSLLYDYTLLENSSIPNSKTVGDKINNNFETTNLFDYINSVDNAYISGTGEELENENYFYSNLMYFNANEIIYVSYNEISANSVGLTLAHVISYNKNGQFLERNDYNYDFYPVENSGLYRIAFDKSNVDNFDITKVSITRNQPIYSLTNYNYNYIKEKEISDNLKGLEDISTLYNILNVDECVMGGVLNANNQLQSKSYNQYFLTPMYKCNANDVFYLKNFGEGVALIFQALLYDTNKKFVSRISVSSASYTCPNNGYIAFNVQKPTSYTKEDVKNNFTLSKNIELSQFYPNKRILSVDETLVNKVEIRKISSISFLITFGKFNITLFKTVDETTNANNWNIKEIKNGSNIIVPEGTDILGPVLINNNSDFIGGVHGDETTNNIIVSIDGSIINLGSIDRVTGDTLTITMKSTVYDQISGDSAFDRFITIIITPNKIHISNNYKALENLTLKRATNGGLTACRNTIINSIIFNNAFFSSAPTTSQNIGSNKNTSATINTTYGSITVNNIKGHELNSYNGFLATFSNESPIRNKIYFDTYKQGEYSISTGDLITGEFEYILS